MAGNTAEDLSKYREALVAKGFTASEIETLVIEAARSLINKGGLKV